MALNSIRSIQFLVAFTVCWELLCCSACSRSSYGLDHDSAPPSGLRPLETLKIGACWLTCHIFPTVIMTRNYQAEAMSKFPAPTVPVEDDYLVNSMYQQALEAFTTQHSIIVT